MEDMNKIACESDLMSYEKVQEINILLVNLFFLVVDKPLILSRSKIFTFTTSCSRKKMAWQRPRSSQNVVKCEFTSKTKSNCYMMNLNKSFEPDETLKAEPKAENQWPFCFSFHFAQH